MFGMPLPKGPKKNHYCSKCGAQRAHSGDWVFNKGLSGWGHTHGGGQVYPEVYLTEDEHAERFPGPKILQKDGGSCIVFDV